MPNVTLRGAVDTYVNQARPTSNYSTARKLGIQSGAAFAYVYFNRPMPLGAIVTTAKLRLYHDGSWGTGSSTVSARRLSEQLRATRATWNNRPSTTGPAASVTDTGGGDNKLVEIDVTDLMQAVADGGTWHGFRIETSSGTLRYVTSTEGSTWQRPTLYVEWSEAPHAPTGLSPNSGKAASVPKPLVRFQVTDPLGDTTLAAVHVQVADNPDFTGAWDSGWVTTDLPQLDLATTAYPGITQGAVVYWRVQVRDGAGLESEWSDDATMTYVPFAAVTIDNPAAGTSPYVADPTPRILWGYAGVQTAWRVMVADASRPSELIADSGKRSGTDVAWTVPNNRALLGSGPYRVTVRVYDNVARDPADPYAELTRDFVVQDDPAVTPVSGLAVAQPNPWPGVELTWTRGTAPDSFVVTRDGLTLEPDLLPEDVLEAGTSYRWVDPGAQVWRPHTWQVKAKVNGAQSTSPVVSLTPKTRGIWLMDEERDLRVWLAGAEGGSWSRPEDATAVTVIGATSVTRRVQGLRNYEGSLSGQLVDGYGSTAAEHEAALETMRREPSRPVVLAVADMSLRVLLGNVQTAPTVHVPPSRVVTFDFWEVT
jgi:hypothetical protein